MNRNPYNLVFLISLVIGSFGLFVGLARAAVVTVVPSCSTPAANWATLTVCRTETARVLTPTPRVIVQTQTPVPQVTPTKVTGTEAPGCWITTRDGVMFFITAPCNFTVRQIP